MKNMKGLLNAEYGSIHAFYWMAYAALSSFASVFLLARGYSNTDIGIIFAASNVASVFLQPLLADIADRSRRFSLISVSAITSAAIMILTLGTFAIQTKTIGLTVIYVLMLAGHTTLQPLFNSLCFKISECGIPVSFGVCRSFGSLAYSILTLFLGTLAEKYGVLMLPLTSEIMMALMLGSLALVAFHFRKASKIQAAESFPDTENRVDAGILPDSHEAEDINLIQFVRRNRLFFIMMIGALGIYFSNGVLNNFMLQIIQPLGGTSEDMGRIFAVMAFLEIPTLVCFEKINQKISCQTLLKVASVAYVAKTAVIWLAGSVMTVLLAHFLQLFSFALFLPAMVSFIGQSMRKGEAVKGQALFTTITTVAYIVCSLLGGIILDWGGAGILMIISTAATAAGAVIVILTVDRIKSC